MKNLVAGFAEFISNHSLVSKKTIKVVGTAVVVAAIPLTVYLSQQNQDIRQRASSSTITLPASFNTALQNNQWHRDFPSDANGNMFVVTGSVSPVSNDGVGRFDIEILGTTGQRESSHSSGELLWVPGGKSVRIVQKVTAGTVRYSDVAVYKSTGESNTGIVRSDLITNETNATMDIGQSIHKTGYNIQGKLFKVMWKRLSGPGRIRVVEYKNGAWNQPGAEHYAVIDGGNGYQMSDVFKVKSDTDNIKVEIFVDLPSAATVLPVRWENAELKEIVMSSNLETSRNLEMTVAQRASDEIRTPGIYKLVGTVSGNGLLEVHKYPDGGTIPVSLPKDQPFGLSNGYYFKVIERAAEPGVSFSGVQLQKITPEVSSNPQLTYTIVGGEPLSQLGEISRTGTDVSQIDVWFMAQEGRGSNLQLGSLQASNNWTISTSQFSNVIPQVGNHRIRFTPRLISNGTELGRGEDLLLSFTVTAPPTNTPVPPTVTNTPVPAATLTPAPTAARYFFSSGGNCDTPRTALSGDIGVSQVVSLCMNIGTNNLRGFDVSVDFSPVANILTINETSLGQDATPANFPTTIAASFASATKRLAMNTSDSGLVTSYNIELAKVRFTPTSAGSGTVTTGASTITTRSGAAQVTQATITYTVNPPATIPASPTTVVASPTAGATYTISGQVFVDKNGDGQKGASEVFYTDTTNAPAVRLMSGTTQVASVTVTNNQGSYSIPGVAAGTYTIRVSPASGTSYRQQESSSFTLSSSTSKIVGIRAPLLSGDGDDNGCVDILDYTIWFNRQRGTPTAGFNGDLDHNGTFNASLDYTAWFLSYRNRNLRCQQN